MIPKPLRLVAPLGEEVVLVQRSRSASACDLGCDGRRDIGGARHPAAGGVGNGISCPPRGRRRSSGEGTCALGATVSELSRYAS